MATRNATKTVNILSRDVIARTGLVLYTILSSDGVNKCYATVKAGEVTCECKGFKFRHTCRHAQYIAECEATYRMDIQSEINRIASDAEQDAINAALDEFYAVRSYTMRFADGRESFESDACYGTCGHLSKNEHDECPACRSKWYR